jgi:hypothetical protein
MKAPSHPRLSPAARRRVRDYIEVLRACGDRQIASDIEVLLMLHDRLHGIEDAA